MYADWLTENGHADPAEYLRVCLGCPSEVDSAPARRFALQDAYVATLVRPKPRGMHFMGIERGLPLIAAHYPSDDLDHCAARMPPHYCVQLVLADVYHARYQLALRHPIMAQVHYVQLQAVDEYDVLALAETRCTERPIGVIAPVITTAAAAAARELLPNVRLFRSRLKRRSRRQRHALWLHAGRFNQ
jgi:hypothetical protein